MSKTPARSLCSYNSIIKTYQFQHIRRLRAEKQFFNQINRGQCIQNFSELLKNQEFRVWYLNFKKWSMSQVQIYFANFPLRAYIGKKICFQRKWPALSNAAFRSMQKAPKFCKGGFHKAFKSLKLSNKCEK